MKITTAFLVFSIALAQLAASAQTAAPAKPHTTPHVAAAGSACVKLPPLSPKIPALPASAPCAKAIYSLTTIPPVKIGDAAPALAASVREYLGIEAQTFSLSYVDIKVGTGEPAAPHKWYSVQYTGYLHDGTVFDSSYVHPNHAAFVLQQGAHKVIPGWDTGFYGMRVGGKRRLFIPHQLAYGPRGNGAVPPNADLVFDIELVSQSDTDPTPAPKAPPVPPPAAAAPPKPAPATQPAPATPPSADAPAATPPKQQ
jgi:peptidylprolyl isomerase